MMLGDVKTRSARRVIALSEDVVQVLKDHRINVTLEFGEEPELVFPSTFGSLLSGNNLLRVLYVLTKRAGVPAIRFHDLRHTAASLMINSGLNVRVVATVLGHANPSITLDVYSHLFEGQHRQATISLTALSAG